MIPQGQEIADGEGIEVKLMRTCAIGANSSELVFPEEILSNAQDHPPVDADDDGKIPQTTPPSLTLRCSIETNSSRPEL